MPSVAVKEKKMGRLWCPKFWAPAASHSFKKLSQGHEDSEYVLSLEIGQRESGFYSERTDRITEPSSTVLAYICQACISHIKSLRLRKSLPQMLPASIVIRSGSGAPITIPILLEDGRRP